MDQLLLHLLGDYVTQTHWMATEKTKRLTIAFLHALIYSLPFLLLSPSIVAFITILVSHAVIDRYRLARYIIYIKNKTTQFDLKWEDCSATGYHKDTPTWLAVWLMIITDNTLHLSINYLALKYT